MYVKIDLEQTAADEWLAEAPDLPGVFAYGRSRKVAYRAAQVMALRTLADLIEAGEARGKSVTVSLLEA